MRTLTAVWIVWTLGMCAGYMAVLEWPTWAGVVTGFVSMLLSLILFYLIADDAR